jgi:hypothetical protein
VAALLAVTLAPAWAAGPALAAAQPIATAQPSAALPPATAQPSAALPPATAQPDDAQLARLAARVGALTAQYRQHSTAAAAASVRLAQTYGAIASADDDVQDAEDRLEQARTALADRVRALYALGAAAHPGLALLVAGSTDDAIWQLSVGGRLAERLLASAAGARDLAEARSAQARGHSAAAVQAAAGLSDLLTQVREQQDAAGWARDQAAGELRRLQELARAGEIARQAAARLAQARLAADETRLPASATVAALGIPPGYARDYHDAAASCPGLAWTLLAAVGQVESGHGRNNGPSSAGAIGPMQFMPATFASYAIDGDHDGTTDPWNPRDAIFTAARYLCVSGAGQGQDGVRAALLTYNHAEWYADLVLASQAAIVAAGP